MNFITLVKSKGVIIGRFMNTIAARKFQNILRIHFSITTAVILFLAAAMLN
jgi:hypothetical protein